MFLLHVVVQSEPLGKFGGVTVGFWTVFSAAKGFVTLEIAVVMFWQIVHAVVNCESLPKVNGDDG